MKYTPTANAAKAMPVMDMMNNGRRPSLSTRMHATQVMMTCVTIVTTAAVSYQEMFASCKIGVW